MVTWVLLGKLEPLILSILFQLPSSESCLGPILDSIDHGLISVVRMPEKGHSNQVAWLSQVFNHSNVTGHELLEVYLGALKSHPTTLGMTAEQLITFTNDEITKDLSNAQIQPAFMKNYRRFVVIRASTEDTIPFDKDGVSLSSFVFVTILINCLSA